MITINPSTMPHARDWSQSQSVRGADLPQTIAQAREAGYRAHRMAVKRPAVYELQFMRDQQSTKAQP